MTRLRWPLLLATAIGLAAAIWATGRQGWADVLASAGRTGLGGFALLCLVSAATFLPLGASWLAGARGVSASRLGHFAWARATREAANDLLPFSQIGGVVVGIRTAMAAGIPAIPVYAATIFDMTTEMAAQLVFTACALWASGAGDAPSALKPVLLAGLAVASGLPVAFFLLQRPALRVAGRLIGRVLPGAGDVSARVLEELAAVYADRRRVAISFLFNLLAWFTTAVWSWIALRLMGSSAPLWHVAALESTIFALRSAAFVVPGALGVQEAGYALLAPLLGIDPAAALALSLVKRARDLTLGIPTLLIWQWREARSPRERAGSPG